MLSIVPIVTLLSFCAKAHIEKKAARIESINFFNVNVMFACLENIVQRAGIADGGEFYIRPPGTAAWLFDEVKY
jgi:hypothetical protein